MIAPSQRNLYLIMPGDAILGFFPLNVYIQARDQSDLPGPTSKSFVSFLINLFETNSFL